MSRQTEENFDRVWRAVIRRVYADGRERVTYHGPFKTSAPAAAAITCAKSRPWYNVIETTGTVESSTLAWESR